MKKFLTVLLSLVMLLSVMPICAFADEQTYTFDEIANEAYDDADFTAFDSVMVLVNAVDEEEYTEESVNALKTAIIDKATLITQQEIDDAVKAIATAYSQLVKKSFDVTFQVIDSNENVKTYSLTYSYGELATLVVADTDEVATKWIVSTQDGDEKLDAVGNEISLIITQSITVTAITDIAPEIKDQTKQVKFLTAGGKPCEVIYTTDVANIEMPEAPALPFYYFVEWVKVDDLTYQASYQTTLVCDGENHIFKVTIIEPTCYMYGYLIFECECGEGYRTEYKRPTGHVYDADKQYCLNGCGTENDCYFESHPEKSEAVDPEKPTEPSNPEEPTKPNDDFSLSFDNDGYGNSVIMP